MAQEGYVVISDITGYTAFLSQSELEHAEDSLRSLLTLLLEHTKPPLVASALEGDAAVSFASQGSFLQGQTLVETLEATYVAYRQALQRMALNTTCTCNACRNIPNLDLKFFVHYGSFILQDLGSHTQLIGSDINLVHRLTKNSITKKTGLKAYCAYTEAAVEALGIEDLSVTMVFHTESYEHLGEVQTHVQDMQAVWERERSRAPIVVGPEEALVTVEHDFALGQALLWDYLTKPEYRAVMTGSDSQEVSGSADGRIGTGTVYYCAHGKSVYPQMIVDWSPFERITVETEAMPKLTILSTVMLTSIHDGTRATVLIGRSKGPLVKRLVCDLMARLTTSRDLKKGCQDLEDRISAEVAEGKVVETTPGDIASQQIDEAVAKSLPSLRG